MSDSEISPNASRVHAYFDRQAAEYNAQSAGVWWRWLREREASAVLGLIGELAGKVALDLGCGAGYYARQLVANHARMVYAVDMSEQMVARLPEGNVRGIVADAASVSFDRKFERIVSAGLLEFCDDPGAILANARRCAADDARFVLLMPRDSLFGRAYRLFHAGNGLRIRLFSADTLAGLCQASGWQLAETRTVWPFTLVALLRPAT